MSAARYVGRVGGLAVALGVGSVIVIGGGVAYADTATSGMTGVSHDTSSSAPAAGQNKSEKVKKVKTYDGRSRRAKPLHPDHVFPCPFSTIEVYGSGVSIPATSSQACPVV